MRNVIEVVDVEIVEGKHRTWSNRAPLPTVTSQGLADHFLSWVASTVTLTEEENIESKIQVISCDSTSVG